MTTDITAGRDLVGAILDRQLEGFRAIVNAGVADNDGAALTALADANRAAIIRDVVEPNGAAGVAAFEQACSLVRDLLDRIRVRRGATGGA